MKTQRAHIRSEKLTTLTACGLSIHRHMLIRDTEDGRTYVNGSGAEDLWNAPVCKRCLNSGYRPNAR